MRQNARHLAEICLDLLALMKVSGVINSGWRAGRECRSLPPPGLQARLRTPLQACCQGLERFAPFRLLAPRCRLFRTLVLPVPLSGWFFKCVAVSEVPVNESQGKSLPGVAGKPVVHKLWTPWDKDHVPIGATRNEVGEPANIVEVFFRFPGQGLRVHRL